MIEKKPFRKYELKEDLDKPLSLKLNAKDKELIKLGMYALNMHSRGGVLKELAHIGLKVIRNDLGLEKLHRFTSQRRVRLIQEMPESLQKVAEE